MNIGILGGSFDPIHNGHLQLGQQAYQEYGLDQIWYMPSGPGMAYSRRTLSK